MRCRRGRIGAHSRAKTKFQVERLKKFKKKNVEKSKRALDKLGEVVESGENCFPDLIDAVEVCSLGQITGRLAGNCRVFPADGVAVESAGFATADTAASRRAR